MSDHKVPSRFTRSVSTVRFDHGASPVTVTVCTSRIVRVELADERDAAGPSYVGPRSWAAVPFEVIDGERVRLSTGDLRVEAATSPVRLTFLDAAGAWLLRETALGGMITESLGAARRRVRATFEFSDEQHFYGLGQGGLQLDRLGIARQLWNTHIGHGPGSDMGIPLLVSHRGYALFFDNTSDAMLSVGRSDGGVRITYTAEAGRLVWYFLVGRDLRRVMLQVAELLGRPPLPPRWALGFLQSTRHFDDTEELRRLPRTIREKRIPCDGLIYLSTYGEAQGWNRGVGHLGFQPSLWPDPPALIDEARRQHFEIITHEYPVLHERSPLFAEAEANGYLLDEGYGRASETARRSANYREGQRYLDFSKPAVGAWWWAAHRELAKLGVAGWWLDGGEGPPATAKLHAGDGTLLHNITTGSATRHSPSERRPTGPTSVSSCSAARGRRGCSDSGRRAGRAISTTTSTRSMRRSPWGSIPACPACRTGARTWAASSIRCRRRASSMRAGSSSEPSAPSSAPTAGCGASTCHGRMARKSRASAVSTRSYAISFCPTRTRWPGRRTPSASRSCARSS